MSLVLGVGIIVCSGLVRYCTWLLGAITNFLTSKPPGGGGDDMNRIEMESDRYGLLGCEEEL